MTKHATVAILFALIVTLTIGAVGPYTPDAYAAGVQRVGSTGQVYVWTAGC